MTMTDWQRIDRLERAIAQLDGGTDWSSLRARAGRSDLNEIVGEVHAALDREALERRQAALERELAGLQGAA